jgi:hypothetical protein
MFESAGLRDQLAVPGEERRRGVITRFRIEAEGNTQEDVIEELSATTSRIISLLKQDDAGEWECTQDIVIKASVFYKGRMVMKFHFTDDDFDETAGREHETEN